MEACAHMQVSMPLLAMEPTMCSTPSVSVQLATAPTAGDARPWRMKSHPIGIPELTARSSPAEEG